MRPTPSSASGAAPVALVTGASRRIGAAIARALHAAGYRLVLHCRRTRDEADALARELCAARAGSAVVVQADLLETARLHTLVDAAFDAFGRLDALVNNASAFYPTPLHEARPAHWEELLGANARAPYFLSQAAAPRLAAHEGAICNILDVYAEFPKPGATIYAASKAALAAMTRGLAIELAPRVRVNGVAPGAIFWPEHEGDGGERAAILQRTPMGRLGTAEEVAEVVVALVAGFRYVTGQVIRVDGGRTTTI